MSEQPITVFDCGVFLQGLMSKDGPAKACLKLIEKERIRLVMSEAILAEIEDVLSRPEVRELSTNLTDQKVQELIDLILEKAEFVEDVRPYFSYPRDKSDESYINLGIETQALFLVSRDNDLLDLTTSHTSEAKEFRQKYRHLKIVEPTKFLWIMREMGSVLKP